MIFGAVMCIFLFIAFRFYTFNLDGDYLEWQKGLSASEYPSDLVIASFIPAPHQRGYGTRLLLNAHSKSPNSPLVNHQIMEHCSGNFDSALCDIPAIETLLKIDVGNGYIYFKQAPFLFANGNTEAALEALRQLGAAERIDGLLWRYLNALDESQSRFGIERSSITFAGVFGLAILGSHSSLANFTNMCDSQIGIGDADWLNACLDASQAMMQRGRSEIIRSLGSTSLVRFSGGSDEEILNASRLVTEEMSELIRVRSSFTKDMTRKAILTIIFGMGKINDSQWQEYLEVWSEKGEIAAGIYFFGELNSQLF